MNQSVIKAIVLISFLVLCLPMVSAAGESAGASAAFTNQDVPDFSSCDITNATTLNPYCPLWDGEHTQPDPFLVYEVRKEREESNYGISSLLPPPGWRGLPTKGTVRIPVFLVDFPDAPHDPSQTVADVQSKMFGNGNSGDYPYESLKNYYQRSSYNQLTITGDVYGWYPAKYNRSYYLSQGKVALINEILQEYDSTVNFADYDADHNGKMDALFIKWAGDDTGWGNFWWACMSTDNSPITVDGVKPYKYVWSWYSNPNGGAYNPRVDIHETGHLLGLPDYYDYDDSTGPKGGVGGWDMMDSNWGDHNAFSKYLLGWIDPLVISSGTQEIILPPSGTSSSNNAVLIMPGAVPDSFGEFFLVQYREKGSGNDPVSGGPDKAVWIWHVDATLNTGGWGFEYDNSYTSHKLLRLMEADGREEIEAGTGDWDVNDFYLPGQVLGPVTVPNTTTYSGSITNVAVTDMQQLVSSMRMDFGIPVAGGPVANFTGTPLTDTVPLGVTFTDNSTGTSITDRRWDFGDGNVSNYTESTNPFHTYTNAGTYSVNLTVTNASGSHSHLRTKYITAVTVAPVASFTVNTTQGTAPLTVKFNDTSAHAPTTWAWSFTNVTGDNTPVVWSIVQSPSSTFGVGNYSIVLNASNSAGSNLSAQVTFINVSAAGPAHHALSRIGVYQNGAWYLDYLGEGTWTANTKAYGFGASGFTPVIGDWNKDGKTKIGVYKDGAWYLDYLGEGMWTANTKAYGFGAPGFTPVIGDWNGDDRDKIGVYKDGAWYLDYLGNGTWTATTKAYGFGAPGFTPVIGDWNGDGRDKIGVYKDGAWYLDYLGNGTWTATTKAYGFGASGFTPIIGDWNGDGRDKIGVYKDGAWYLDYLGNGTWTSNTKVYSVGAPGYTPVIGDWNGDGRGKVGVYKDGAWYLDYLGNGTWTATTKVYSFGAPGFTPLIGKWS